jgi:N-ethylmaleimide reductase
MPTLFDPISIGSLDLSNRIVMAPLTRNRAPGAIPNDLMTAYYTQRASAGLIVTEGTAISHQGQGYAQVPGLYSSEQLAGWKRVTDSVHAAGGKIVVQMWHVGRISHASLLPDHSAPVAPSAIRANSRTYVIHPDGKGEFVPTSAPRALTLSEIADTVQDYRRAARVAVDAGFDGAELHAANGYLIDQFLRSDSNKRNDAYGGSIENRARLLFEVLDAIIAEVGPGRMGVRLSPVTPSNDASDPDPQPLFMYVARKLAEYDLAYIHIIEGATGGARDFQQGATPFDYASLRQAYIQAGGKGAWMANNGYNAELAKTAIRDKHADLIAFGKPFIANPDLVRRLQEQAPLNTPDQTTFYGGGEGGYIDYPALA